MAKNIRKGKKRLFVWLDEKVHDSIRARAELRNIEITRWIIIAVADLMEKEDKYQ